MVKLFRANAWINIYFYRGSELNDPAHLFDPSDNRRMRSVRVEEGRNLDRTALRVLAAGARALATESSGDPGV